MMVTRHWLWYDIRWRSISKTFVLISKNVLFHKSAIWNVHLRGCFRPLIPIDICTTRICHHSPLPRPFGLQSALLPQWASVYENWWWTRLRWGCDNHDTWGNYANCPDKAFISLPHYSLPCIIASHKRDKTRTLSLPVGDITSDDTQQTSFFLSLSLSLYIYINIYITLLKV